MPSFPARRAPGLLVAVLLGALAPGTALAATPAPAPVVEEAGASPASTPGPDAVEEARKAREAAEQQVAAFQSQVDAATAVLTEGTQRLEAEQAELARVQSAQVAAEQRASAALARAEAARAALATVAAASFRQPVPDAVHLALSTGPDGIRDAVVARADLDRVRGSSTDTVRVAKAARVEADSAVRAAAQLTEEAARKEAGVAVEVEQLKVLAEQTRVTLEAAAAALAAAQQVEQVAVADAAARAAAEASAKQAQEAARAAARANRGVFATCTVTTPVAQPNGFLQPATLCPLDDAPGAALVPDAAAAFNAMNAAHKAERGTPLCITDSYRDYAGQVAVYATKPNLAAVPGTSNHGWGLALDLCGGVERFGSEAHLWMRINAGRFGWFHPAWAQQSGSRPEAWHWEYATD